MACNVSEQPQPSTAVLGVLSHGAERQRVLRESIRETWARGVPTEMLLRFVMRSGDGSNEAKAAQKEALLRGDVVLLPGLRARTDGALSSLLGWFACAVSKWPNVQLIGKAEDDVFLRMDVVAQHVHEGLALLSRAYPGRPSDLYMGTFETSYWATHRDYHAPRRWKYWYTSDLTRCKPPSAQADPRLVWGPFAFGECMALNPPAG